MKKYCYLLLCILTMVVVSACGTSNGSDTATDTAGSDTTVQADETTETDDAAGTTAADGSTMDMTGVTTVDAPDGFDQTAAPSDGDTVATISVEGYGDIKVRLFEEIAPYGVKNFVEHAKEGYYDGLTFHRVISDFMIQGGDPLGTGTGGESIWNTPFYNETSEQVGVIRGSLCYANSGVDPSNGSQFFITQMQTVTEDDFETYESNGYTFTDEQKQLYLENGGCPWLQGGYTVFGQVYEGMDIVDQISAVETDDSDKPTQDVIITSVTIDTASAVD